MFPKRIRTLIAVLSVLVATTLLYQTGILQPVQSFLQHFLFPLSQSAYTSKLANDTSFCPTLGACQQAFLEQGALLRQSIVASTTLERIQKENNELRTQLHYILAKPLRTVGADVVGRDERVSNSSLRINRGSIDGIVKGDPVIVDAGVLVGKISRVELRSAVVQLLTDNQSKVAATVVNNDNSIGVVEGGYEISVQMNLIPQHEIVSLGDMIITSGLESQVPRGLVIGRVEAVKKEVYQPFQQAVLTPLAPLKNLTTVLVILESDL